MTDWSNLLLNSDYGGALFGGTTSSLFMMALSFLIGHFIGFVYMWTHEALSYSRTFVTSLVVMPVLIAVMMIVMVGNLLMAFGLLAVFGVIRFRNVLKDTRDTTFVLWAVMEGMTVGTMRYSTAIIGALGVGAVLGYLRLTSFGTRQRYDAILTLRLTGDLTSTHANLRHVLSCYATRIVLVSERRAAEGGVDLTYQLLLRDPSRFDELQATLSEQEGTENSALFLHDDEAEI